MLNAIFNLSTAVLFGFFLKPFTKLVEWIIPNQEGDTDTLRIEQISGDKSDITLGKAAIYALQEDVKTLIDKAFAYCVYVFGIDQKDLDETNFSLDNVMKDI